LLLLRPPPRPTLFPYTTLFRSAQPVVSVPLAVCAPVGLHHVGHVLVVVAEIQVSRARASLVAPVALVQDVRVTGIAVPDHPCSRSEEHTSELQSRENLVCRLLL